MDAAASRDECDLLDGRSEAEPLLHQQPVLQSVQVRQLRHRRRLVSVARAVAESVRSLGDDASDGAGVSGFLLRLQGHRDVGDHSRGRGLLRLRNPTEASARHRLRPHQRLDPRNGARDHRAHDLHGDGEADHRRVYERLLLAGGGDLYGRKESDDGADRSGRFPLGERLEAVPGARRHGLAAAVGGRVPRLLQLLLPGLLSARRTLHVPGHRHVRRRVGEWLGVHADGRHGCDGAGGGGVVRGARGDGEERDNGLLLVLPLPGGVLELEGVSGREGGWMERSWL